MSDKKEKKPNSWLKTIGWTLLVLCIGVIVPALPLFSESYGVMKNWVFQWQNQINPEKAGQFGDFVGGFIGTVAFIVSLFIVYVSYHNQKTTNEKTLKAQEDVHKRTTFEARFFELLRYHRENVADIEIETKKGRRAFVSMIREFRMVLKLVKKISEEMNAKIKQDRAMNLAYLAFYYGVGWNSTRIFKKAAADYPQKVVEELITKMGYTQVTWRSTNERRVLPRGQQAMDAHLEIRGFPYRPFDGHQSRLGHYYRHLYQLMKYVDNHAQEPSEYGAIVRAQLSNHEQALLCLNSLSSVGKAWRLSGGYLTKYGLIQNIPESFFNETTELDVKKIFPGITFEFEKQTDESDETNREGDVE